MFAPAPSRPLQCLPATLDADDRGALLRGARWSVCARRHLARLLPRALSTLGCCCWHMHAHLSAHPPGLLFPPLSFSLAADSALHVVATAAVGPTAAGPGVHPDPAQPTAGRVLPPAVAEWYARGWRHMRTHAHTHLFFLSLSCALDGDDESHSPLCRFLRSLPPALQRRTESALMVLPIASSTISIAINLPPPPPPPVMPLRVVLLPPPPPAPAPPPFSRRTPSSATWTRCARASRSTSIATRTST